MMTYYSRSPTGLAVSEPFQQRRQHFYYVGTIQLCLSCCIVATAVIDETSRPSPSAPAGRRHRAQSNMYSAIVTRHFSRVHYINGLTLHKPLHSSIGKGRALYVRHAGQLVEGTRLSLELLAEWRSCVHIKKLQRQDITTYQYLFIILPMKHGIFILKLWLESCRSSLT